MSWEVAEDKAFARIVAQGNRPPTAASDHTVKADVRGLRPATAYWFRFTRRRGVLPRRPHPYGPGGDAAAPGVRFGVVSCANWESGYFAAYRHLAARADLDAVLHLGDYIYEYADRRVTPRRSTSSAQHEPSTRSSPSPTTAPGTATTRRTPTCRPCTPRTRSSRSGTTTSSPTTPGRAAPRTTRRARRATGRTASAAAKQAYFEWMPVRASDRGHHLPAAALRQPRRPAPARPALLPLRAGRRRQRHGRRPGAHDHRPRPAGLAEGGPGRFGRHLEAGRHLGDDLAGRLRLGARPSPGAAGRVAGPAEGGPGGQRRPVGRLHRRPQGTARRICATGRSRTRSS